MGAKANGELTQVERVFAALTSGGVMHTTEIAAATGMTRVAASQALAQLLGEGKVLRSKAGGPKAPPGQKERSWKIRSGDRPSQVSVAA